MNEGNDNGAPEAVIVQGVAANKTFGGPDALRFIPAWLRWGAALLVLPLVFALLAYVYLTNTIFGASGLIWWGLGLLLGTRVQCVLLGYSWKRWLIFATTSAIAIGLAGFISIGVTLTDGLSLCRSHAPEFLTFSVIGVILGGLLGLGQGVTSREGQALRWGLATAAIWILIFTIFGLVTGGIGPDLNQCGL